MTKVPVVAPGRFLRSLGCHAAQDGNRAGHTSQAVSAGKAKLAGNAAEWTVSDDLVNGESGCHGLND